MHAQSDIDRFRKCSVPKARWRKEQGGIIGVDKSGLARDCPRVLEQTY